jgi:hypothetical protein
MQNSNRTLLIPDSKSRKKTKLFQYKNHSDTLMVRVFVLPAAFLKER